MKILYFIIALFSGLILIIFTAGFFLSAFQDSFKSLAPTLFFWFIFLIIFIKSAKAYKNGVEEVDCS